MTNQPQTPRSPVVEIFSPDRRQTAWWNCRRGVGYDLTWHHRITFREFGACYAAAIGPVPERLPVRHVDEYGFSPGIKPRASPSPPRIGRPVTPGGFYVLKGAPALADIPGAPEGPSAVDEAPPLLLWEKVVPGVTNIWQPSKILLF